MKEWEIKESAKNVKPLDFSYFTIPTWSLIFSSLVKPNLITFSLCCTVIVGEESAVCPFGYEKKYIYTIF